MANVIDVNTHIFLIHIRANSVSACGLTAKLTISFLEENSPSSYGFRPHIGVYLFSFTYYKCPPFTK